MRKFYIIAHNPDSVDEAINALQNKANALEPDIAFRDGQFWVYDPDVSGSWNNNVQNLGTYCNGLASFLIENQNNANINLALIAWDLKNSENSNFDFGNILQIIDQHLTNVLDVHGYGMIPNLISIL
jgi:hypothetical protein